MRTISNQALPDSCVVQGQTFVSDDGGGGSTTWTASGTFDCRVAPVQPTMTGEDMYGGRITPESEFVFTFPAGTDVDEQDRLIYLGGTYNVSAVRDRSWEITTRVEAVKQT